MYQLLESGNAFDTGSLKNCWSNHKLYNSLHKIFVHRLSTEVRLSSSNALVRSNQAEKPPIYKLGKNEKLAQKISDYFYQAFGVDLVVNRNEMMNIPLHVGKAPDKTAFTINEQDDYYQLVAELPKLHEQGDGMRSFASILLNTFTSDYSITLIDEPEAFLHPPQANIMGRIIGKTLRENQQAFISTHSEEIIKGLLDVCPERVKIVRITREEDVNEFSVLEN